MHQLRAEDILVDLARTEGIAVELEARNLAKLKESLQSAEVIPSFEEVSRADFRQTAMSCAGIVQSNWNQQRMETELRRKLLSSNPN